MCIIVLDPKHIYLLYVWYWAGESCIHLWCSFQWSKNWIRGVCSKLGFWYWICPTRVLKRRTQWWEYPWGRGTRIFTGKKLHVILWQSCREPNIPDCCGDRATVVDESGDMITWKKVMASKGKSKQVNAMEKEIESLHHVIQVRFGIWWSYSKTKGSCRQ